MKDKAFLFGPFFGELSWEYFRFAPYAIYLKKNNPDVKVIVLTRPERFDLYGRYSDILVPLKIGDSCKQRAFGLVGFNTSYANQLSQAFEMQYKKEYSIERFCPDFSSIRYNLKWQFPRSCMDYDFIPRKKHSKVVSHVVKGEKIVLVDEGYDFSSEEYNIIKIEKYLQSVMCYIDNKRITYIGCLIELIKRSLFVVSNLKSDVGRLSILLKKPLIYLNREMSYDSISLLNPYKTPIIDCSSILEGVKYYEDNF